jgi:F-type H+-transporting ATPase subunit epsilon
MTDVIQLEVLTPERQIISVQVAEVQFPTANDGYYGVLPGHTPLVTPVGDGLITFTKDTNRHWVTVFGGFAEVTSDRVTILARVSETVDMIDVNRAESARMRALQAAREAVVEHDLDKAQASLRASLIRLTAARCPGGHNEISS